jgi:hypothetical protein
LKIVPHGSVGQSQVQVLRLEELITVGLPTYNYEKFSENLLRAQVPGMDGTVGAELALLAEIEIDQARRSASRLGPRAHHPARQPQRRHRGW